MATTTTLAARSAASSSSPPPPSLLRRHAVPLAFIIATSFALRIALITLTSLPSVLESRLELNDPYNSWKSVLKTVWALDAPPSVEVPFPYRGESIETFATPTRALPPPLLLMILGPVLPTKHQPALRLQLTPDLSIDAASILFALIDVLATFLVFQIAALRLRSPIVPTRTTRHKKPVRLEARTRLQALGHLGLRLDPHPLTVATIYAFNPLTLATCLARSGTTLISASTLLACWAATSGYSAITGLSIAASSLLCLHPILLAPPLIALCARQKRYFRHHLGRRIGKRQPDTAKDWQNPLLWTGLFLCGFAWISAGFIAERQGRQEVDKSDWLALLNVYKAFLTLPTLTPGLSLWWYFFVEIFEHFRHFFLLVFNAHLVAWTAPITLRYRHDPLFATFLLLGVQAIFKPYPTAGDVALWLSLGLVFPEYAAYLRNPLPPALLYLYATLLIPSFSHLFLVLGSANANFLYAVGLVWSLGGVTMWLDWAWAGGRAHWEREREAGVAEVDSEEEADDAESEVKAVEAASPPPPPQQKRNKKRLAGTKRTVAQV